MSKLDELIKQYCPNGVEYFNFYDVAEYIRGVTYGKSDEITNGENGYNLLRANNITLESNTLNYEDVKVIRFSVKVKPTQMLTKGDILICAGSGSKEHIGKVAYIFEDIPYTFGGFMGVIRSNENLVLNRYMFHILTSNMFKEHLYKVSGASSSTINNINNDTWKDFSIPVPPLPVQSEIVRILDSFTALTAELTAELTARKKQYEYYRERLLTPMGNEQWAMCNEQCAMCNEQCAMCNDGTALPKIDKMIKELCPNGVEWKKVGEVCSILRGKRLTTKELIENGKYPVIHGGTTPMGYYNQSNRKAGTTIVINTGNAGCVFYIDSEFWSSDACFSLYPNADVLDKFLYYFVSSKENALKRKIRAGAMPTIDSSAVENLIIPIPPMAVQTEIVAILDRFDSLCNDITVGLPAEIEARQKQYEYYREKLLSFSPISN